MQDSRNSSDESLYTDSSPAESIPRNGVDESSFGMSFKKKASNKDEDDYTSANGEQTLLQQICEKVETVSDQITAILPAWSSIIGKLQSLTGYKKRYILLAMFASPVMLLSLVLFAHILIPLVMLIYPVIMSVKAIEQKQEARTRWLIFWLFYNTSVILEYFIGGLLHVIPGYTIGRGLFFVWCMAPVNENGCYLAYHLVRPLLMLPIQKIDMYIIDSMNKIETVVRENEHYAATATLQAATMAGNLMKQQINNNNNGGGQSNGKKSN